VYAEVTDLDKAKPMVEIRLEQLMVVAARVRLYIRNVYEYKERQVSGQVDVPVHHAPTIPECLLCLNTRLLQI
jgi:hypothetical protein